jgi:SAGA-associated factor 29
MFAEPSVQEIDVLGDLWREANRINERSLEILKESSLLENIPILQGIMKHTEDTLEAAASSRTSRDSRSAMEYDGPSDSPVPSPAENKHIRKHAGQPRTSSQPPRDKESAKNDKEERESSNNASRTKITFALGGEVAFKPKIPGQTEERDWIQGIVVKVIGEGKSRRYDVQDPYPDDTSKPGEIHRTSASSMVTIPPLGTPLPDYELGKKVLALFPESSTFYRAEVKGTVEGGAKVELLFEEESEDLIRTVSRRFVLDHKG